MRHPTWIRYVDFISPECRFPITASLGRHPVHVVHGRRHADDLPILDGNDEVVPWIREKFRGPVVIDRLVEDTRRDIVEDALVSSVENSNLDCHAVW